MQVPDKFVYIALGVCEYCLRGCPARDRGYVAPIEPSAGMLPGKHTLQKEWFSPQHIV